jgi:hypothetical protein
MADYNMNIERYLDLFSAYEEYLGRRLKEDDIGNIAAAIKTMGPLILPLVRDADNVTHMIVLEPSEVGLFEALWPQVKEELLARVNEVEESNGDDSR